MAPEAAIPPSTARRGIGRNNDVVIVRFLQFFALVRHFGWTAFHLSAILSYSHWKKGETLKILGCALKPQQFSLNSAARAAFPVTFASDAFRANSCAARG
jgi:hypothetical protein